MRHRSLPRITVPIACTADWKAMRPLDADGRARLCGACDTPVYDTRSMTRGELQRLILKHEGSLPCLRLHQRPDGTIVTGSCLAPVLRAGRLLWLKAVMAAVAFWSAVIVAWSWTRRLEPSVIESDVSAKTESRKLPFVLKPRLKMEDFQRRVEIAKAHRESKMASWTLGKPVHVTDRSHHRKPIDDPLAGLDDL